LRRRIDALVVLCLVFNPDESEQLRLAEFPTIVVGGPGPGVRHMGIDDRAAGTAAANYLLGLGHTKIAHLGGEDELGSNIAVPLERQAGYVEALTAAGIATRDEWTVNGRFSFEGGQEAMRGLLEAAGERPTAVFAASDEMAFGAITAIVEAGLRVPNDVSVIGIDGHQYGAAMGLTTISQNPYQQGADATRVLLAELDGGEHSDDFPAAPFELVVRSSTAPPTAS
jgi:DNA-binding LacI/PurR family transcriptional regulator